MAKKQLEFWFDLASTYSYLSALRIESLADDYDVDIIWRPFVLGVIFKAQGWETSPFNIYEAKGAYMWRDVERVGEALGLPVTKPDPFPQNSLQAARLVYALSDREEVAGFVKSIFLTQFGEGWSITDKKILRRMLRAARVDADATFEAANTPEMKAGLKKQTQKAIDLGIFGSPSFVTEDGELFWGDDRLEQALDWAVKH